MGNKELIELLSSMDPGKRVMIRASDGYEYDIADVTERTDDIIIQEG